jgi:hypothetical protein
MRHSVIAAAMVLLFAVLASGYAVAATAGSEALSAKPIPTITAALPPASGTPASSVTKHNLAAPGLGRTTPAFRRGQALLTRNRYVGRATEGQRLTSLRADPSRARACLARFWALVDFHQRVASFLPVVPDTKPPYHLVDPTNYSANVSATPPG